MLHLQLACIRLAAMSELAAVLRAAGLRATPARLAVLRLLREARTPLAHAEIERRLAREEAPPDRVTLYRVLEAFVAAGLVAKAVDRRGVARFSAFATQAQHQAHVHFHCTGCGGVFCLKDAPPPPPKLPRGFRLETAEYDLSGICARCARRMASA